MKRTEPLFSSLNAGARGTFAHCASAVICTAGLCAALGSLYYAVPAIADEATGAEEVSAGPAYTLEAPVATSYDAAGRVLCGSTGPGLRVALFDTAWQYLTETPSSEDGSFALVIPEGLELESLLVAVLDENGGLVAEPLLGSSAIQEIAVLELQAVAAAASRSTTQIVSGMMQSVQSKGITSQITQPEPESLPVLPYALGAGSALLGVGLAAGIVAVLRRRFSAQGCADAREEAAGGARDCGGRVLCDSKAQEVEPVARNGSDVDTFTSLVAVCSSDIETSKQVGASADDTCSFLVGCAVSPLTREEPDELELLAIEYVSRNAQAGRSEGAAGLLADRADRGPDDPDDPDGSDGPTGEALRRSTGAGEDACTGMTLPFANVPEAQDSVEFAAVAQIIATGQGKVHRVSVPSSHLDFSGMDIVNESVIQHHDAPAADPMVVYGDWRGVALSELSRPTERSAEKVLTTDEYVDLLNTKLSPMLKERQPFSAPVIGPGIDPSVAEHRQRAIRSSKSSTAAALRSRDEEFLAQRGRRTDVGGTTAAHSQGLTSDGGSTAAVFSSGIQESRSSGTAEWMSIAGGADAGVGRPMTTFDFSSGCPSDNDGPDALAKAISTYAAFSDYTTRFDSPLHPASKTAARASTEFCKQPGTATPHYVVPLVDPSYNIACGQQVQLEPGNGYLGDGSISADYIDYMVQDEFAHRHDTMAQRNAALGRMRIVNGSASAPLSVREARHRNRA